ncbi:hypothetical protein IFVP182_C260027 [Vibrio parahaemolyticus]
MRMRSTNPHNDKRLGSSKFVISTFKEDQDETGKSSSSHWCGTWYWPSYL